ncbi:flavodoxin family protein [Desulfovibrio sp. OttesenSCG-928-O18]|nr:flavodoxin family protein [Desulfovibrio sp. OttesenSCG-928-O18]
MKLCVLMASPRKNGNTQALLDPFLDETRKAGGTATVFRLYGLRIEPCLACRKCQQDWTVFGCPLNDDLHAVFDAILASDHLVLATPIYSWFCTAPLKAALDRLVYGMNKYYGTAKGPALWAGKAVSIIATCGYRPEKGADLFEEGVRRYCKHSQLRYAGMLTERHLGYGSVFMDEEKEKNARAFARAVTAFHATD